MVGLPSERIVVLYRLPLLSLLNRPRIDRFEDAVLDVEADKDVLRLFIEEGFDAVGLH